MTPDELFAQFTAGFAARRFSAGLMIAFIDFYLKLGQALCAEVGRCPRPRGIRQ
ncbi:MAG: hypothetical protein GVY09_12370 [Gammaproteobacteria bacterium]|jgi:hypothetical protein|nr:hypothetical protein [Gammaproteobacteria bacterium]